MKIKIRTILVETDEKKENSLRRGGHYHYVRRKEEDTAHNPAKKPEDAPE